MGSNQTSIGVVVKTLPVNLFYKILLHCANVYTFTEVYPGLIFLFTRYHSHPQNCYCHCSQSNNDSIVVSTLHKDQAGGRLIRSYTDQTSILFD